MYDPLKEETKEYYLKIWTHYAVGHFNQEQLAKLFGCSQDTIANAIECKLYFPDFCCFQDVDIPGN